MDKEPLLELATDIIAACTTQMNTSETVTFLMQVASMAAEWHTHETNECQEHIMQMSFERALLEYRKSKSIV